MNLIPFIKRLTLFRKKADNKMREHGKIHGRNGVIRHASKYYSLF